MPAAEFFVTLCVVFLSVLGSTEDIVHRGIAHFLAAKHVSAVFDHQRR